MMPSAVSAVVFLLTLLVCVSAQQPDTDTKQWYTYAQSPEAVASANATLELNNLPPEQRTLSTAVKLCHKQGGDNFCAWISVDDSLGGRPVAVSCFNELHRQCNRRERLMVAGGTSSKFRKTECELCSPCVDGKFDACPTCRRVCYCTCDHYRHSGGTEFSRDGSTQTYQCHEFCDGQKQCRNELDERSDSCSYYKLAGDPEPELPSTTAISLMALSVIVGIAVVGGIVLFIRYKQYQTMLHRGQAQPMVQIAAPPTGSYPHQEPLLPPQSQGGPDLPPPPSYDAAK